ncbi:hypothetical protein BKA81DRAFT_355905 [Phyllosticta paracitricarpa]
MVSCSATPLPTSGHASSPHFVNKQQQKRSIADSTSRLLAPSPTLCRPTEDVRWRRLCSARLIRAVRLRRWLRKTRLPYVDNGLVGVLTAVTRRGQRMLQTPFQYHEPRIEPSQFKASCTRRHAKLTRPFSRPSVRRACVGASAKVWLGTMRVC